MECKAGDATVGLACCFSVQRDYFHLIGKLRSGRVTRPCYAYLIRYLSLAATVPSDHQLQRPPSRLPLAALLMQLAQRERQLPTRQKPTTVLQDRSMAFANSFHRFQDLAPSAFSFPERSTVQANRGPQNAN